MIWWKWVIFAALTVACAVLYRMGGSGDYDTKARDFGCAICNVLSLILIGFSGAWWQYFLAFGLLFAGYTTYHKWLNPLFGDNKDDVHWYGWFMHGFALGFALMVFYQHWNIVLIRSALLGLFTMIWSVSIGDAVTEERGRGFLSNITLLWFLID